MNDNAFDEALRHVAADKKLPYAEEAWTRMAARLDAHSSGKGRGLVIPISVIRWAAAAAIVALALVAGWWLRDAGMGERTRSGDFVAKRQDATQPQQTSPSTPPSVASSEIPSNVSLDAARSITASNSMQTSRRIGVSNSVQLPVRPRENALQQITAQAPLASSVDSSATETRIVDKGFVPPGPFTPARGNETQYIMDGLILSDEMPKRAVRTGFDVAGGYGYGGDVPAFSVGVAVRRPVSSRLQLEGALALVGTTPDPIGSTTKSDNLTPTASNAGSPGFAGQSTPQAALAAQEAAAAEAEYEELRARQIYVQAAPVLMYRVLGGLSAGGGLDAQRRVSANTAARERAFNSFSGVSVPALPEWDFGLALRADYNVTKAVRLGVQYRESLRATSADGTTTEGRNYWLLQAGFRIR